MSMRNPSPKCFSENPWNCLQKSILCEQSHEPEVSLFEVLGGNHSILPSQEPGFCSASWGNWPLTPQGQALCSVAWEWVSLATQPGGFETSLLIDENPSEKPYLLHLKNKLIAPSCSWGGGGRRHAAAGCENVLADLELQAGCCSLRAHHCFCLEPASPWPLPAHDWPKQPRPGWARTPVTADSGTPQQPCLASPRVWGCHLPTDLPCLAFTSGQTCTGFWQLSQPPRLSPHFLSFFFL